MCASTVIENTMNVVNLNEDLTQNLKEIVDFKQSLVDFQLSLNNTTEQIKILQLKSKDIDEDIYRNNYLMNELNNVIKDLTIKPKLINVIYNTDITQVDDWCNSVQELEYHSNKLETYHKLKSKNNLQLVLQSLKLKAMEKIRLKLLSSFQPFQTTSNSNIPFHQLGILLKYAPLFGFIKRQNHELANEIERTYVNMSRGYYETCLVRYTRDILKVLPRFKELSISNSANAWESSEENDEGLILKDRLKYSTFEGPNVFLAYQSDDPNFKLPPEALFRSLLLTFVDNACSEFTFDLRFFNEEINNVNDKPSVFLNETEIQVAEDKNLLKSTQNTWNQIFEPALNQVKNDLIKIPSNTTLPSSLFSMIRINDECHQIGLNRGCLPIANFCSEVRLIIWPIFQREMNERVLSLHKLSIESQPPSASLIGTASNFVSSSIGMNQKRINKPVAELVTRRYINLYTCLKELCTSDDQMMLQSNIKRLRTLIQSILEVASQREQNDSDWLYDLYSSLANSTRSFDDEKSYWMKLIKK